MPVNSEVAEMLQNIENEKIQRNKRWNEGKVINAEGKEVTYKEAYLQEVRLAEQKHKNMADLAKDILPKGKYILFIDMVEGGLFNFRYDNGIRGIDAINSDRLALAMQAQTGRNSVSKEQYQEAAMRYSLGLDFYDPRMQVYRPLHGDNFSRDLSDCAGVVFSGAETNLVGKQTEKQKKMIENVTKFINHAHELGIPMFGVCFGSQILNHAFGAKVDWVNPKNPNEEEAGLVRLQLTDEGEVASLFGDIPKDEIYINASHQQKVVGEMPEEIEILAHSVSEEGEKAKKQLNSVHITKIKHDHTIICIQGHPEVTDAWVDISHDIVGRKPPEGEKLFQGLSARVNEELFRQFWLLVKDAEQKKSA